MKLEYKVDGMTCNGCVASVQKKLMSIDGVSEAIVTLEPPIAEIKSSIAFDEKHAQEILGKYKISKMPTSEILPSPEELAPKSWTTYKPLILIVLFILGTSIVAQFPFENFSTMLLMRYFMAGFFIVFSFFKLLNLSGFASSYSMYDIIAGRWYAWGFIYPFIELTLGALYLTNVFPYFTNIATIVILGVSSIGVIKSNLDKREIKCACLGDVFNLPMSTVTIVEDVSMVLMAIVMLFFVI